MYGDTCVSPVKMSCLFITDLPSFFMHSEYTPFVPFIQEEISLSMSFHFLKIVLSRRFEF